MPISASFRRAVLLSPHSELASVGLFHTLWASGKHDAALKEMERFLADLFRFLNVDSSFHPNTSHKSLQRHAPRFAALNYAMKRFDITHRLNQRAPSWLRPSVRNTHRVSVLSCGSYRWFSKMNAA